MFRWVSITLVAGFVFAASSYASSAADAGTSSVFQEDKIYLIIHADDAGVAHNVNDGTLQAMTQGVVSSASILVPCPWFPEFVVQAKQNSKLDFGVHLTLTSEPETMEWGPAAPRTEVPSLVNKEGYMWDSVGEVVANVKIKEAEHELRAQIDRALQAGIPISHLDPHMGAVVSRPDLVQLYVKLAIDYDVPVLFCKTLNDEPVEEFDSLGAAFQDRLIRELESHGLPVLDALYQYYDGTDYDQRKTRYLETIRRLKPGVTEIIVHCGIDGPELQALTGSHFVRDTDRRIMTDPDVISEIDNLGIELITFKQFHEMKGPLLRARYQRKSP